MRPCCAQSSPLPKHFAWLISHAKTQNPTFAPALSEDRFSVSIRSFSNSRNTLTSVVSKAFLAIHRPARAQPASEIFHSGLNTASASNVPNPSLLLFDPPCRGMQPSVAIACTRIAADAGAPYEKNFDPEEITVRSSSISRPWAEAGYALNAGGGAQGEFKPLKPCEEAGTSHP